jgi:hypothetical protein
MTRIMNVPESFQGVPDGAAPEMFYQKGAVDGDRGYWKSAPVGSICIYKPTTLNAVRLQKVMANGRDDDWAHVVGQIAQRVTRADFTDGGSTSGTLVLRGTIPIGAIVLGSSITSLTGFTGDTSATV